MSKRKPRSKSKAKSPALKKPVSPEALPEVAAPPEPEHVVDTSVQLDDTQAALDALTRQLSELEALSQETEALVSDSSSEYKRSLAAVEDQAKADSIFRDHREPGPLQHVGDRIAEISESPKGRIALIGGLSLFAVVFMVTLILIGRPSEPKLPEAAAPVALPQVAMGETLQVNGLALDVATWQRGKGQGGSEAWLSGDLVIVDLGLVNEGDSEISLGRLLEQTDLLDDQGRVLTHSMRDDIALLEVQGAMLSAGAHQRLRLVFRAHPDSTSFRMEIRGDKPCQVPLTLLPDTSRKAGKVGKVA